MKGDTNAMLHDFNLIYELGSGMGTKDEVLGQLADSDCADATVVWGRPGMSAWLSAARRAIRLQP